MLTQRRIRFRYPDDLDPAWIPRHPEFAYAANGLSLLMPHAEPLFIQAVRRGLPRLDDDLRARTQAYIRQEVRHHREHARFNEIIRSHHPGVVRVERWAARCAAWVERRSTRFNLAFAAGGEIMSFLLARWVDRHTAELFDHAEPVPTTLFLWHLAEEVEHKSSAFQVYDAVDGSKLRYAVAMVLGATMLFSLVWIAVLVQLRDSHHLFHPASHLRLARWGLGLAFTLLPVMAVSVLPHHGPDDFADPVLLPGWLRQYDPDTETMPIWRTDQRTASFAAAPER